MSVALALLREKLYSQALKDPSVEIVRVALEVDEELNLPSGRTLELLDLEQQLRGVSQ